MKLRRIYKAGHAVVIAIPQEYLRALHLLPGTDVVVTLKDRAVHITRAIITGADALGAPDADAPAAGAPKESR